MIHAYSCIPGVILYHPSTLEERNSWGNLEDVGRSEPAVLLATSDTSNINDGVVATMERFTILLYHQTSNLKSIGEECLDIFTR